MLEAQKRDVIRVHIGYNYMLLDRTPGNLALVDRLMNEPCYTTVYDADYRQATHVLRDGKVAAYAELTRVDVIDMIEADYKAAIAVEQSAEDPLLAEAAE